MARNLNDDPACWQFSSSKVNFAAAPNLHRRCPLPAERFEQLARRDFVNSGSCRAFAASPLALTLLRASRIHHVVDFLIWPTLGDTNSSNYTVACFAALPRCFPAAVVEDKLQAHTLSGPLSPSVTSFSNKLLARVEPFRRAERLSCQISFSGGR